MVRNLHGGVEEGEDAVAHEFVDGALLAADDLGHVVEIAVQFLDQMARFKGFCDAGEALNIGDENAEPALFDTDDRRLAAGHQTPGDFRRHIAFERSQRRFHCRQGLTQGRDLLHHRSAGHGVADPHPCDLTELPGHPAQRIGDAAGQ